jgi:hypothetical protein
MVLGGKRQASTALPPQEAGWSPLPVWKGVKTLAPTGIISPDRINPRESLYRLRSPGPRLKGVEACHSCNMRLSWLRL